MESDLATIKRNVSHLIKEFDYQKKELKGKSLKELVAVVKSNGEVIPAFVDTLFGHFRRDDSDVRLATLFIVNHFFQRSHNFRMEMINSIQDFLIYTLETDPLRYPLPKPSEAANLLKKESLAVLRCWVEKYGPGYGKLEKLEHFLRNSKSIDWKNSRVELSIDRERESREQFQREIKARKVTENITKLFGESRLEIEHVLVESQNVIEMIFPKFCPLSTDEMVASTSFSQNPKKQLHGFGPSTAVTVSINPTGSNIEQNCENEALFSQLTDTTAQLEIWWNKLGKWLKKLASVGDSSETMRRIIDARRTLGEDLLKCRELKGKRKSEGDELSTDENDDDSDLVDVDEKEGYEPEFSVEFNQSNDQKAKCAIFLDERPGPSEFKEQKEEPKKDDKKGRKSDELNGKKCIPKLAMGLDLKYWGEEHIKPAERVRSQAEGNHFWRSVDENADNVPTEHIEAYHSRQITFVGQMLPIKKRCRAPLPSGKLCPRMERERCALHGPIIDRDELGFPQEEQKEEENEHLFEETYTDEDERREESEAEFLHDVEEATGVNLTNKKKAKKKTTKRRKKKATTKKKGKKKKKTARERPKPKSVTSRERLVAKLFDKQTLRRVTKTLEQVQKGRAQRKFSSQFNYALERK